MVQIGTDDLLLALKRFKGLAKQDILVSERTSKPEFWKTHAEARRMTYAKLIDLVENSGVENACVFAFSEYQFSPSDDPATNGSLQALEMFFKVVGVVPEELRRYKSDHMDWTQLTNMLTLPNMEYCV